MTEGFWSEEVPSTYGGAVTCFMHPLYPRDLNKGKEQEKWGYAEVTDDTTFTLLIADSIIEKGEVNQQNIIQRILTHETRIKGWPGWEGFSQAARLGEKNIAEFAKWRDGNGAPIRVSPIGIINRPGRLQKIISDVDLACSMSHASRSALAGSCAVAAAVSAAVEGWSRKRVFNFAVKAARLGERLGNDDACPPTDRIMIGMNFVNSYRGTHLPSDVRRVLNCGFQAYEGVPYALTLAYGVPNARDAILGAVSQGGDADSIASMAGSVSASMWPNTLPDEWVKEIEEKNNLNLKEVALKLAKLRS
jgi:ADP-ribosylglycohydrolase